MIPKIVHYAWFGSDLPEPLMSRVEEWKKVLPDWEFRLWSEKNYDLSQFEFSQSMYQQGKLGYAADELRYDVLYKYGGFYFDTDMLVKRPLDVFLDNKMVWGFQYDNSLLTSFFGSEPATPLLAHILEVYAGKRYPELHADAFKMTSNPFVTKIFLKEFPDFRTDGSRQALSDGSQVYPKDYFTYPSKNADANFAEHLFDNSWGTANRGLKGKVKALVKKESPYLWASISAKRGIKSALADGVPLMRTQK